MRDAAALDLVQLTVDAAEPEARARLVAAYFAAESAERQWRRFSLGADNDEREALLYEERQATAEALRVALREWAYVARLCVGGER